MFTTPPMADPHGSRPAYYFDALDQREGDDAGIAGRGPQSVDEQDDPVPQHAARTGPGTETAYPYTGEGAGLTIATSRHIIGQSLLHTADTHPLHLLAGNELDSCRELLRFCLFHRRRNDDLRKLCVDGSLHGTGMFRHYKKK